jgi:hypothetical protein
VSPQHPTREQAAKRADDAPPEPRSGDHDMPRGEEESRQKKRPIAGLRGQRQTSDVPFHSTLNLDEASDTNQQ